MNILFKYYSGLNIKYFDRPTIKISSTNRLNDPFEKIVEAESMNIALNMYATDPSPLNNFQNDRSILSTFNEVSFSNMIDMTGIVSLTETPRNLLMWSHYANQHKGICIGYKSDYLNHKKGRKHQILPTAYRPRKINYDNCRYDKFTDTFRELNLSELRKSILMKSLLTKGNDWIYEKEHRSIIPIEYHDQITCLGKKKASYYKQNFNHVTIIDEDNFRINTSEGNAIKNSFIFCDNDLMFTIHIKKASIASIYFGCESNHTENMEIYNKICSDKNLSHINVFQVRPSNTRFELNIIPFDEYIRPHDDEY